MSNARNIEITAKTEEEARQLALNELNENETIVCSETISAPAKGLFGLVGKQEYKIRFTIDEKPEEKAVERTEKLSKKSDFEGENSEDSDKRTKYEAFLIFGSLGLLLAISSYQLCRVNNKVLLLQHYLCGDQR